MKGFLKRLFTVHLTTLFSAVAYGSIATAVHWRWEPKGVAGAPSRSFVAGIFVGLVATCIVRIVFYEGFLAGADDHGCQCATCRKWRELAGRGVR